MQNKVLTEDELEFESGLRTQLSKTLKTELPELHHINHDEYVSALVQLFVERRGHNYIDKEGDHAWNEDWFGGMDEYVEEIVEVLNHRFETILSALYAITGRDEYRVLTTCGVDNEKTKKWGCEWTDIKILNK
jgi:hypothetical protein